MAEGPQSTIIEPSSGSAYDDMPSREEDEARLHASVNNMEVNYANQNKWYAYFPIEDILGKSYSGLNLHLTRFSIPQLEQTSMTVPFRGYDKEVPAKVLNAGTKQVTLEYIVD